MSILGMESLNVDSSTRFLAFYSFCSVFLTGSLDICSDVAA
jgi:hypothetical protein